MPDDPISVALDAACEWMHANCGEAESVAAWRRDAAGTIATFLRARGDAASPDRRQWWHDEAAAVERVAREASNA